MSGISVTGRIISLEQKTVCVDGVEKQVYSGIIADKTGKVRFSAWKNFNLVPDAVIKIQNVYVKTWRGLPDITFDNRSTVEFLKAVQFPSSEELRHKVSSIEDALRGSGVDVELSGRVIDLKAGTGLIFRCPECKRVTQKGVCRVHEKVEPVPDLRVKAVLDDGTAALTIVMNKELTEQILGKSLDDCMKLAQKELNPDAAQDRIADLIMLRPLRVRGNITRDSFGAMMLVTEVRLDVEELRGQAEAMLAEIERWGA
jgi:replication factor A1